MSRRMRTHGFTLLEVLVVLAIVAMAMSAGFQMLDTLRVSDDAIKRASAEGNRAALQHRWLRDVLESLVPVDGGLASQTAIAFDAKYESFFEPFRGATRQLSGLTIASISQPAGVPIGFRLTIEPVIGRDDPTVPLSEIPLRLMYRDEAAGEPIELSKLAPGSRFEYQDVTGDWFVQWPGASSDRSSLLLPRAIRLIEPTSVLTNDGPLELDPNVVRATIDASSTARLFVPQTTALLKQRVNI